MATFRDFVAELAQDEISIAPSEVREMRARFGDKVLQMGHLQPDGSIRVPVDCVFAATRSVGNREEFSEEFVDRVSEARRRKLAKTVGQFQAEADEDSADRQWKEIEKLVFGIEYKD